MFDATCCFSVPLIEVSVAEDFKTPDPTVPVAVGVPNWKQVIDFLSSLFCKLAKFAAV